MGLFDIFKKKSKSKKAKSNKTRVLNEIKPGWTPAFKRAVKHANELGTDLLEMTEHHCTCGECAKYQGRVFSISGRNKKYPRLPECILEKGCVHKGCRHDFFPYVDGTAPTYHKNIVAYSNSPFIDNRSPEEIAQYDAEQKEIADRKRDEREYKKICEKLPEIAPKSLAGYRRMKNAKSNNYLKLVDECKRAKITIKE